MSGLISFRTACGHSIKVTSSAQEHLRAHPESSVLLGEAISKIILPNDKEHYVKEVDMGRVVGEPVCVPVLFGLPATFAVRIGRAIPSRVVVGGKKVACETFTVVVQKNERDDWELVTGYVGFSAPREPSDPYFDGKFDSDEFTKSLSFWTNNGLVWDPEIMSEYYESTWEKELGL